jgi:hypothetical protein
MPVGRRSGRHHQADDTLSPSAIGIVIDLRFSQRRSLVFGPFVARLPSQPN